jgi:hypothetical protein
MSVLFLHSQLPNQKQTFVSGLLNSVFFIGKMGFATDNPYSLRPTQISSGLLTVGMDHWKFKGRTTAVFLSAFG